MTGRISNATTEAGTLSGHVPYVYLVKLEFGSGFVHLHSGLGEFPWNGDTYLGVGKLGKISEIAESETLEAHGIKLELSGVDVTLIAIAMTERYQGLPAQVWLAILDQATFQVAGDPIGPFAGRMDTMDVTFGKTATITLSVESRLRDWQRPRIRRYTDADQRAEFPEDTAGRWITRTQEQEIIF